MGRWVVGSLGRWVITSACENLAQGGLQVGVFPCKSVGLCPGWKRSLAATAAGWEQDCADSSLPRLARLGLPIHAEKRQEVVPCRRLLCDDLVAAIPVVAYSGSIHQHASVFLATTDRLHERASCPDSAL